MQNYLVFQPIYRYFKRIVGVDNSDCIYYWQSKGLSDERINSIKTSDYGTTPTLSCYGTKTRVEFNGSCLKQDKITYTHGKIEDIYTVYGIFSDLSDYNYLTLQNALFGAVKLTKNADINKYRYSGYGIGFDGKASFSFPGGGLGCNETIFGVDMSLSTKIDNRKKDILILGKGPIQGLEHTLSAEKMNPINFTGLDERFCPSLNYNGSNSCLFVNGTEIHKFKGKDSEIVVTPLCLGNISKTGQ